MITEPKADIARAGDHKHLRGGNDQISAMSIIIGTPEIH
jgi:hypothetical protein